MAGRADARPIDLTLPHIKAPWRPCRQRGTSVVRLARRREVAQRIVTTGHEGPVTDGPADPPFLLRPPSQLVPEPHAAAILAGQVDQQPQIVTGSGPDFFS